MRNAKHEIRSAKLRFYHKFPARIASRLLLFFVLLFTFYSFLSDSFAEEIDQNAISQRRQQLEEELEKLENQIAGEEIYVEVVPDGFEIIETSGEEEVVENTTLAEEPQNQTSGSTSTENETLVTITEKPKKRFKLLGWAIFGDNEKLKEIIYYAGGVILFAIIAFFVFRKFGKRKKEIKVKKLSDWIQEQKQNKPEDYSGIIREAQQKIEDAQKEINRLKNQDKIREAERKLQQDQAEIRRLRGF